MGNMRLRILSLLCVALMLASCGEYQSVLKYGDYEYKYEVAKAMYADGHYRQAAELFSSLLAALKGTQYGDESLYMAGESNLRARDYESAAMYFKKYYQTYPKGPYVEQARYNTGYSLYRQIPDIRLDQTSAVEAINEFQNFLDYFPNTSLKDQTQEVIYDLQDRLVEKEYLAAKLYYDLGTYIGNSVYGGSNYEACIVTAQNALKDFPYASSNLREKLSALTLRAKFLLATQSIEQRQMERFRDVIDEYYAFYNDFPESDYMKEATTIFNRAEKFVNKRGGLDDDDMELVSIKSAKDLRKIAQEEEKAERNVLPPAPVTPKKKRETPILNGLRQLIFGK